MSLLEKSASPVIHNLNEIRDDHLRDHRGGSGMAALGRGLTPTFYAQLREDAPSHYLRYYINYDEIKNVVKIIKSSINKYADQTSNLDDIMEKAVANFKKHYRKELDTVNTFALKKRKWILNGLNSLINGKAPNNNRKDSLWLDGLTERTLDFITAEIVHLDRYIRANMKIGARLIQIFLVTIDDVSAKVGLKASNTTCIHRASLYNEIMSRIRFMQDELLNEDFCNIDVDSLILFLSVGWDHLTKAKDKENDDVWKPPTSFIRNTTKYWVTPDRLVDCKCSIVKHMPFLIFGKKIKDLEILLRETSEKASIPGASLGEPDEPIDSQLVSSVYLDNEMGDCFHNRVLRMENATLIRYRWYGQNTGSDDQPVFIERKTHHESWSGLDSTKERFLLPQGTVKKYLNGEMSETEIEKIVKKQRWKSSEELQEALKLATESDAFQKEQQLSPTLRTSYNRCAFQHSANNDVRFSLDHNLCMINEKRDQNSQKKKFWCLTADEAIGSDALVRFPFAVLEVKLQCVEPGWVKDMLETCEALSVAKFSKFQHGMSMLHPDVVKDSPAPHWIEECIEKGWLQGFAAANSPAQVAKYHHSNSSLGRLSDSTMLRSIIATTNFGHVNSIGMNPFTSHGGDHFGSYKGEHFSGMNAFYTNRHSNQFDTRTTLNNSTTEQIDRSIDDVQATYNWYQKKKLEAPFKRESARHLVVSDPKIVFAAERVFLKYCRKSLYLLPLVYYSLNKNDLLVGTFVGICSMLIAIYAWVQLVKRQGVIESGKIKGGNIDDRLMIDSTVGPNVILALIVSSMGIIFLKAVHHGDFSRVLSLF